MILSCPACATRYEVDGSKFPSAGRNVRCAKCGHTWHQVPEADPDADLFVEEAEPVGESEQTIADAAAVAPQAEPDFASEAVGEPEPSVQDTAAAEPEEPAAPEVQDYYQEQPAVEPPADEIPPEQSFRREPEIPDDFAMAAEPSASQRRASIMSVAGIGFGWLALIAVVLAIGWAALTYREQVMADWPQSASLYAKMGVKTAEDDLFIENLTQAEGIQDGQPMLTVTGTVINRGQKAIPLPQLRAALLSDDRRELYHWTFSPSVLTLEPGQSTRFSTRVSSPPPAARHLDMRFARAGE
jgi:predicted Zn finger-like uncharacterized protein